MALSRIVINTRVSGGVDGLDALRTLAEESEKHPVREWAQTIVLQHFSLRSAKDGSEVFHWMQTIAHNLTQIRRFE
jgi:hypothetical protein